MAHKMMLPRIKDGRTFWYRKTLFFTKDEFVDGYTGSYWRQVTQTHRINSYGATYEISKILINKRNYSKVSLLLPEVMMLIISSV